MDELASDLEAQSPMLEDEATFVTNLDGHLAPPRRQRSRAKRREQQDVTTVEDSGIDLATELGRAVMDLSGVKSRTPASDKEGEGKLGSTGPGCRC